MRVSEIRVKQICVNQGLGVFEINDTQWHSGEKTAAKAFKPHHCESQITRKSRSCRSCRR